MKRDDLVGDWTLEPGGNRITLQPDGSAVFVNQTEGTINPGSWMLIDPLQFRTIEQMPGTLRSGPSSLGMADDTIWETAEESEGRLVVYGRQGEDGTFECQRTIWHKSPR